MLHFAHQLGVDIVWMSTLGPQIGQSFQILQYGRILCWSFDVFHSHLSYLLHSLGWKKPHANKFRSSKANAEVTSCAFSVTWLDLFNLCCRPPRGLFFGRGDSIYSNGWVKHSSLHSFASSSVNLQIQVEVVQFWYATRMLIIFHLFQRKHRFHYIQIFLHQNNKSIYIETWPF